MFDDPSTRRRFLRNTGVAGAAASLPAWMPELPEAVAAGSFCPHPNPIVQENRCTDPFSFTGNFQLSEPTSIVAGFARQTSVNIGSPVDLVISGPNNFLPSPPAAPLESVQVEVYRLGYYEGYGGRKVWTSPAGISTWQHVDANGTPSNSGTRRPARPNDPQTGLIGEADDRTIVTVPGSALTVSGVYLARCRCRWTEYPPGVPPVARTGDSHIVWIVRDDGRPRDLLVVLPTNTWQAYNSFTGRSLYTGPSQRLNRGSIVPATGTERAAKVSFDRPYSNYIQEYSWVLRAEFPAIWWLERHGYDVAYTEDVALSFSPAQVRRPTSKGVMILGHSEYWSQGMVDGIAAARDSGTSIYSLSANTCYWRVRYETASGAPATNASEARVLVCYKTAEGGGSAITDRDSTAPLTGPDAISSAADPVSPTTTWRDPGKGPGIARPGTLSSTPAVYAGPNAPESALFGNQFIGYDDAENRGLTVPSDNGQGEFAGHRAWRYCGLPAAGTTIGTDFVGWEWDGVPDPGMPFTARPVTAGGSGALRRMSATDPRVAAPRTATTQYLLDAGRRYSALGATAAPPPGSSGTAHAVTYTAPSGALVFSSGTMLWSWGLGPHYVHAPKDTSADPPVLMADQRIVQATTNLLADGGILPITPEGLLFDAVAPYPTDTPAPAPTPTPNGGGPGPTPTPPAPPSPKPPATKPAAIPVLTLALKSAKVGRSGRVSARVRAAAPAPRAVSGTVALRLGRTTVATGRYAITAGATRSGLVRLRLSSKARRTLKDEGRLAPLAAVAIVDGRATIRTDFTRLRLRREG